MEKKVFVVRKATYADIPQIQKVSREAFNTYAEGAGIAGILGQLNETYGDLKEEIDNKMVLVALMDETIVGCVRVKINTDGTAYLSRFGVRNEFHSKGIGKLLMGTVDEEMKKVGIKNLYLHTSSRMLSLVRFYYGRGFYIESTTKDRGYIRALLCKEYEVSEVEACMKSEYKNIAVI